MRWILFLDDIRTLDQAGVSYPKEDLVIIARNMDDAIFYVQRYGIPQVIHFDHDLADVHYIAGAGEKTGYTFAKWFCDYVMDNGLEIPRGFGYFVHSMNPVGAENIRKYMENFLKAYEE